MCLGEGRVADRLVHLARARGLKNGTSGGVEERPDRQLRQTCEIWGVDGSASRKDQYDGLGGEAARHEAQDLRRRAVEPMRIVHEADQWLRLGVVGEQAEHGHPDQESIRRPAAGNSERPAERVALWNWPS